MIGNEPSSHWLWGAHQEVLQIEKIDPIATKCLNAIIKKKCYLTKIKLKF